jgi:hypothetical protein
LTQCFFFFFQYQRKRLIDETLARYLFEECHNREFSFGCPPEVDEDRINSASNPLLCSLDLCGEIRFGSHGEIEGEEGGVS